MMFLCVMESEQSLDETLKELRIERALSNSRKKKCDSLLIENTKLKNEVLLWQKKSTEQSLNSDALQKRVLHEQEQRLANLFLLESKGLEIEDHISTVMKQTRVIETLRKQIEDFKHSLRDKDRENDRIRDLIKVKDKEIELCKQKVSEFHKLNRFQGYKILTLITEARNNKKENGKDSVKRSAGKEKKLKLDSKRTVSKHTICDETIRRKNYREEKFWAAVKKAQQSVFKDPKPLDMDSLQLL